MMGLEQSNARAKREREADARSKIRENLRSWARRAARHKYWPKNWAEMFETPAETGIIVWAHTNTRFLEMVTSKDIASELGLSQPTVSRILSGDANHRAAEETRQRVWEAAQRLGYQPNAVARSLRRGRTGIIGIHTSHNYDVRNDFLGTVVGALQCACAQQHLDVLLHSGVHGSPAREMFGKLRDGRVDGLILHSRADDPLVELLNKSSLPVVAVADELPGLPAVTSDDANGMRQLIDLLWERGHRKFVFLAPRVNLPSVEERLAVYEGELEARGVPGPMRAVKRIAFEDSAPVVEELRAQGPLCVCCWNDRTAYNLLNAALETGISVPQELAIAGFDGLHQPEAFSRHLTTVRNPWEDVSARALEMLVALIARRGESQNQVGQVVKLQPWVLPGDTT